MTQYFRPLAQLGAVRPAGAVALAGGWAWCTQVEVRERGRAGAVIPVAEVPGAVLARLTAARADLVGLTLDAPRIMGILNVTPDSFSDGGRFDAPDAALAHARGMVAAGADILDIGGESTRPGAAEVQVDAEIARTAPVIAALRAGGIAAPISIDTRKAAVAQAALAAGAGMLNDVSGLEFDAGMAPLAAQSGAPICVMHAQGVPETMHLDPRYNDVLLDVYDALEARLARAEAAGIARGAVVLDPGIGFGKTQAHNLALLRGISLFHGLGCALLLGVSRKRFIGSIGRAERAEDRAPGSIAVGLAAVAQGVQLLRVHDVGETAQALRLWRAVTQEDGT